MASNAQLSLNIQLRDDATFDNFYTVEGLQPLLMNLQHQTEQGGEALIYLYGAQDTGKSHLLQGACHQTSASALYLPLAELRQYPPADVLQGVESAQLLCLDDIDVVLGDSDWETELFHLFNRARDRGCRLLVSGAAAPRALSLDLADLRSRLSWGIVYQMAHYGDEDLEMILQYRAQRRGLPLPPEVARYIVLRAPRSLGPLLDLLDTLDQASLAQQRALSIPFVRQVLDW